MSAFSTDIARILKSEGGYTNNPKDKGKETNFGITIATARANGYTGQMADMSQAIAINIYKSEYWDKVKADSLPPVIGYLVLDAAVNCGTDRAAKFLQTALRVTVDGNIGAKTLAAANAMKPAVLALLYLAVRTKFYTSLSEDQWNTFGKGWENRMADNMTYAAADLGA